MPTAPSPAGLGRRISGRAQQDPVHDPYQPRQKLAKPSVCGDCGAVYRRGRWQWGEKPEGAQTVRCPACRRIADRLPAGVVTLYGEFARHHRAEIEGLARNEAAAEGGEHPLNRIIAIEEADDALRITTTDLHLPRRLGHALQRAFDGELDMDFDESSYSARVDWRREA